MTLCVKVPKQNNRIPNGVGRKKNGILKEVVATADEHSYSLYNVGLVQTQMKAEVGELY